MSRSSELKRRAPELAFGILSVVAFGVLLYLSSNRVFAVDEWAVIRNGTDWSLEGLMKPYIEHWAFGLRVMWKALLSVFGMTTYMPYLIVNLVLHVTIAAGIFVLARRQVPALIALAVGTLFLFLGSGALDLLFGFQMGWNGAAAAGTWALVILLREPAPQRTWLASLLLLIGVATWSSIGLLFVAAAGAALIVAPDRRRHLWVVLPALVAYAVWFLAYGQESVGAPPALPAIREYVIDGIANATGQVSGLGAEVGLVIAVLLALSTVANLVRGERLRLPLLAGTVGLTVMWLLLAWGRAADLPDSYPATRYVYISGIFILIALLGLLAHRDWPRHAGSMAYVAGVVAVFGVALTANLHVLRVNDAHWQRQVADHRAVIELATTYGGSPALPADQKFATAQRGLLRPAEPGEVGRLPDLGTLNGLLDRYGSPLDDPLAIRGSEVTPEPLDRLFALAVAESVVIDFAELPPNPSLPSVDGAIDLAASEEDGCLALDAAGESPSIDVSAPSGSGLYLWTEDDGLAGLSVSLQGTFGVPGPTVDMLAGDVVRFALPDLGEEAIVRARVSVPSGSSSLLCADEISLP